MDIGHPGLISALGGLSVKNKLAFTHTGKEEIFFSWDIRSYFYDFHGLPDTLTAASALRGNNGAITGLYIACSTNVIIYRLN